MSYPSSPLSPYLGALDTQFAPGPFIKFVSLSLMVLYQLESLHWDDYNLIYNQNKNMGFLQIFDSISFENSTFSLFTNTTQNQSKPIPTNNTKQPQHNPKTHLQPKQNSFYPHLGFSLTKHKNKGVWVYFLPQPLQIFSSKLFDLLGARDGKQTQPKLDLLQNPSFFPFSPLFFSQKTGFAQMNSKTTFLAFISLI